MVNFMRIVFDIVIFALSLSVIVMIHELGHFSMAKLFNVYCHEFSIGFGPAIYKKKVGETTYSLRSIPLGGYVSMAGEDDDDSEKSGEQIVKEKEIPVQRTIAGISHWKKAIIFAAGIILNFVLAYVLFFINFAVCEQPNPESSKVKVVSDSLFAQAGLESGTKIIAVQQLYSISQSAPVIDTGVVSVESYYDISNQLLSYKIDTEQSTNDSVIYEYDWRPKNAGDSRVVTFIDENNVKYSVTTKVVESNNEEKDLSWGLVGVTSTSARIPFSQSFGEAGKMWVMASSLIYQALGGLFVGKGLDQLGGPIAIIQQSSSINAAGFGAYLSLWGMISANLAIFNLLPFPGLDGWHLVVAATEGVTKKEINPKFKRYASMTGMLLLFGLMIIITIKDIFRLF